MGLGAEAVFLADEEAPQISGKGNSISMVVGKGVAFVEIWEQMYS